MCGVTSFAVTHIGREREREGFNDCKSPLVYNYCWWWWLFFVVVVGIVDVAFILV